MREGRPALVEREMGLYFFWWFDETIYFDLLWLSLPLLLVSCDYAPLSRRLGSVQKEKRVFGARKFPELPTPHPALFNAL
jgi:hypothetical protein